MFILGHFYFTMLAYRAESKAMLAGAMLNSYS